MKITLRTAAALTASAVLVTAAFAAPVNAAPRSALDGIWKTDGYGLILSIENGRLLSYETTSISCLPDGNVLKRIGPVRDGAAAFGTGGAPTVTLRARGRDRARAHYESAVADIDLVRLRALPERCSRPMAKDPLTTFDVFWTTFAENYPSFAAKKVDWQALRDRYRPKVDARTGDERLFEILAGMMKKLGDSHTGLMRDEEHLVFGNRSGTRAPTPELKAKIDKAVAGSVDAPLKTWANGEISYADLPDGLGYLRLTALAGYTGPKGTLATERAELDRALDAVFTRSRVRDLRGLIIDVRYNLGGYDELGMEVAARLTGKAYTAFTKRARNHPTDPDRYTRPRTVTVRPADAPVYDGPVAVLTSGMTISAGETFTMGLMGRTPEPIRIGGETQGAFSDMMARYLPNGWRFALSNEDYRTRAGRTFEGVGIPPQIRTPVFTDDELAGGHDSALQEARTRLLAQGR
ncbi:S41 family peptidase [Planomonospora parontospora]|uniref:S41 family peptidase n=1 Tax=Planomonospora parontospora TaxID=58119 RepID=UPI0019412BAC|nr:S41 family peptidase [Planomonospora parontospora]GII20022.1 peptidase [Planomonospora parontospora subsp. antibiotica]